MRRSLGRCCLLPSLPPNTHPPPTTLSRYALLQPSLHSCSGPDPYRGVVWQVSRRLGLQSTSSCRSFFSSSLSLHLYSYKRTSLTDFSSSYTSLSPRNLFLPSNSLLPSWSTSSHLSRSPSSTALLSLLPVLFLSSSFSRTLNP